MAALDAVDDGPEAEDRIAEARREIETALARLLPLLDPVADSGRHEAAAILQRLATENDRRRGSEEDPLLDLALHDLLWSALVYALAHDWLDVFPRLGDIVLPRGWEVPATKAIASADLHHLNLFDRESNRVFTGWRDWLADSFIPEEIPALRREMDLDAVVGEVEILTSMALAAEWPDETTYCHVVSTDSGGERLLRIHARGPDRGEFARAFEVKVPELDQRLNELYGRLVGVNRFRGTGELLRSG